MRQLVGLGHFELGDLGGVGHDRPKRRDVPFPLHDGLASVLSLGDLGGMRSWLLLVVSFAIACGVSDGYGECTGRRGASKTSDVWW